MSLSPDLVRPIIGIENRTAQEVFDIMADRILNAARAQGQPTQGEGWREAAARIASIKRGSNYATAVMNAYGCRPINQFFDDLDTLLRLPPSDQGEGWRAMGSADIASLLNTPELHDFAKGCVLEAAHQRERWGAEHDVGKAPLDWFWLIGYLAQKAATAQLAGDTDKALHHTISTGAALANWHAAITGASTIMRPGIAPPPSDQSQQEDGSRRAASLSDMGDGDG